MTRYIYALICPLSKGIKYIGQTKRPLQKRLSSHFNEYGKYIREKKRFTHKINWMRKLDKAGLLKNIEIKLIEECLCDTVNEREIYWIEFYKDYNLVNASPGGCLLSEESIERIRQSKIGKKNPNFGKKMSPEQKSKLLKAGRDYFLKFGNKKSDEYRKKLSEKQSIPVTVLDENLVPILYFSGSLECAKYFNYTRGNIKNAIRFSRPIGRWRHKVLWVVRTENEENGIQKIKDKPENQKILESKKFS